MALYLGKGVVSNGSVESGPSSVAALEPGDLERRKLNL